jgi:hypothetical protein
MSAGPAEMNLASRTQLGTRSGGPKQCFAFEANEPSPRAHRQAPVTHYFLGLLIELRHLGIELPFCLGHATLLLHHPTPLRPKGFPLRADYRPKLTRLEIRYRHL